MTMHIVGPWLSTTGKKKSKQKFKSADEAKRARELDAEWQKLMKKYGEPNKKVKASTQLEYKLTGRVTQEVKSKNTGHTGAVTVKQTPKYTGTKILGIGTMHKSNAVPIFNDDEAKSISSMRR